MTTKEKLEQIFGEIKESEWVEYAKVNRLIDELAKERERYDELKAKYDSLVMDNMTLEYNAAEAEKHLPDLIKQFVDQERERAAKLVRAVESFVQANDDFHLGYINRNSETTRCGIAALSLAHTAAEKRLKIALSEYRNQPETTGNQTAC